MTQLLNSCILCTLFSLSLSLSPTLTYLNAKNENANGIRMWMNFTNLFNGNDQLAKNMNKFINENWREILDDLKETIVDAFGSVFIKIINHVLNTFSYSEMFI